MTDPRSVPGILLASKFGSKRKETHVRPCSPATKGLLWMTAGLLSLHVSAAEPARNANLTREAGQVFDWVVRSRDHQDLPFMIIDKRRARVWVFDGSGELQGDAPVLLGSARGDHTLPGIGDMKLADIKPEHRTTPAGRFKADLGKNLRGEDVVWVDYDAGVSMHPVLTTNPAERREERLKTPSADDNRVSYGCINVPKAFHEKTVLGTVRQAKGGGYSVVYILPESRPLTSVFADLAATLPTPIVAGQ